MFSVLFINFMLILKIILDYFDLGVVFIFERYGICVLGVVKFDLFVIFGFIYFFDCWIVFFGLRRGGIVDIKR